MNCPSTFEDCAKFYRDRSKLSHAVGTLWHETHATRSMPFVKRSSLVVLFGRSSDRKSGNFIEGKIGIQRGMEPSGGCTDFPRSRPVDLGRFFWGVGCYRNGWLHYGRLICITRTGRILRYLDVQYPRILDLSLLFATRLGGKLEEAVQNWNFPFYYTSKPPTPIAPYILVLQSDARVLLITILIIRFHIQRSSAHPSLENRNKQVSRRIGKRDLGSPHPPRESLHRRIGLHYSRETRRAPQSRSVLPNGQQVFSPRSGEGVLGQRVTLHSWTEMREDSQYAISRTVMKDSERTHFEQGVNSGT